MKTNQSQKNIKKEWQYKELGELLDYEQPQNYIVESENYSDEYNMPVLTAGKTFILGYTNENSGIYKDLPVIIFDDFTTAHKFVDFPFKVKSSAMKILKAKDGVNIKFIYGWIQIHPYTVGEHKRNYLSEYQYQDVLLPPLFEQNRIVSVLETWDKTIENLNKKIEIKKQIKKGLMQDLLTGKKRLNGFQDKWQYIKIKNLTNLVQGTKSNGGDVGYLEIGDVNIDSKSYNISKKDKLTVKGAVMVPKGTLLISTVRPTRGAVTITKENLFVSGAFCKLNIKNLFIYYIVNSKTFLNYLGDNSGGGTYPTCKNEDILEYEFLAPPSLKEQSAIAEILGIADKEITELENKLEIVKEQKRYLLNNLITGAIRTPALLNNFKL